MMSGLEVCVILSARDSQLALASIVEASSSQNTTVSRHRACKAHSECSRCLFRARDCQLLLSTRILDPELRHEQRTTRTTFAICQF
jgi:hypothetical protein